MAIAGFDEVGNLLGRLSVDNATKSWRFAAGHANHPSMIGNHAYLYSADACMTGDHFLCIVSLKLVEMAIINQTLKQLSHIIGLCTVFRNVPVEYRSGA